MSRVKTKREAFPQHFFGAKVLAKVLMFWAEESNWRERGKPSSSWLPPALPWLSRSICFLCFLIFQVDGVLAQSGFPQSRVRDEGLGAEA